MTRVMLLFVVVPSLLAVGLIVVAVALAVCHNLIYLKLYHAKRSDQPSAVQQIFRHYGEPTKSDDLESISSEIRRWISFNPNEALTWYRAQKKQRKLYKSAGPMPA